MAIEYINYGTRRVQDTKRGHTINLPSQLVKTFGIKVHDRIDITSSIDGVITMRMVDSDV